MKYFASEIAVFFSVIGLLKAEQQYTVTNEEFKPLNGLKETIFDMSGMKLVGRQRLFNGTYVLRDDMASDHYKLQLELFSSPQGDDQFKRLPMGVPRTTICEGTRGYYGKMLQPSFVPGETTNFPFVPEEGICPLPKGEYFVKNLVFDTDYWPNQIPRGIIKAVLTLFKDEINVGGGALYMRIEDRN